MHLQQHTNPNTGTSARQTSRLPSGSGSSGKLNETFHYVMFTQMSDSNPEMRATAARICRDYLHGVWKHVNSDNIVLKHISGGLSNWVYNVQLPEGTTPLRGEPRQVLLRIYGQTHGERAMEGIITESVIFTLLSERKLGPKLHGVFPGGRIEEYIPARPLLTKELADPELSALTAEKMAHLHMMQVPINKEPTWLWDTMAKWRTSAEEVLKNVDEVDTHLMKHIEAIKSINFSAEIAWFRSFVSQHKYPIVFCHNDMQEGNILLRQNSRKRELVIIDFEYCSYNYRGFDLANHFVEWQYDYTAEEYPFFHERTGSGPTDEQKLHFIRSYLKTTGKEGVAEENRLMEEVKVFTLASHLFWGLWSVVNAGHSNIPFGYWVRYNFGVQTSGDAWSEIIRFEGKKLPETLNSTSSGVRTGDYATCRLSSYQHLKEKISQSPINASQPQCGIKRKEDHTD